MNNFNYAAVVLLVEKDFDKFDGADKIKKYCAYNRVKHIQMAANLTIEVFDEMEWVGETQLEDYIHGLNHLFFNGAMAGQFLSMAREEE